MTYDGLYHRRVWWPDFIKLPHTVHMPQLTHTLHVLDRVQQRCPIIKKLPTHLSVPRHEIIEAEVIDGKLTKVLVRTRFNDMFDAIYAIAWDTKAIKTAWVNSIDDDHANLDLTKYRQY